MGSIYLIRHGQASFGADDYDVLCANGVRQSQILGEHLARLGTRFDLCYSGELQRQRHTAEHALDRLRSAGVPTPDLCIEPAFNEFRAEELIRAHLPELLEQEPRTLDILSNVTEHRGEFQRLFQRVIDGWLAGRLQRPGLESWEGFASRVELGLRRVIEQAGERASIAVFTSGGAITALLHRIIGVPPLKAFELNWQIVNTSLTHLKFRGSDVSLASFNNHAHLELLKAPELITYR